MRILALDHVQLSLPVGSEDRARHFYGEILGLEEIPKPPRLAPRGGVWFLLDALQLHLGADPTHDPKTLPPKAHIAFAVENLADLTAILTHCTQVTPVDFDLPGAVRLHCRDPFGNRLEFMQRIATGSG